MVIINSLIKYTSYVAIGLLIVIAIKTIIDLIRRKRKAWIDDLRVLVNYGFTLIICWSLFLSYALIVRPPVKMESSYDSTIKSLKSWIINDLAIRSLSYFGIIIFFTLITYLIQRKFEKDKSLKLISALLLINGLLLTITIALTYLHTLIGLSIEISYHFSNK